VCSSDLLDGVGEDPGLGGRLESIANGLTNMAGQAGGFQMSLPLMAIYVLGFISYAGLPVWFIVVGRLFLTNRVGQTVGAVVAS